jgi:hypothetical protein
MMTLHHLRTVDPAVEPLRAGTVFSSGAAKKDIACNFAELHEVHIFGMLFLLEKLASRISSHVELPLSQHGRGVVSHTKESFREDKSLPGKVSCACTETRLLGLSVAARRWLIFLNCSHITEKIP